MIPLGTLAGSRYAPTDPQVFTSDSFNRADGNLSGSTDAALGGTPLPWHVINYSPFQIISNRLEKGGRYAYAAVDVGVSSMVVSFRIVTLGNNPHLVLFASSVDEEGDNSAYGLSISASNLRLSVGDIRADAPNTLTGGDLVELVSDFPDVSARVNGVTVMSLTDATGNGEAPGTYAGLYNLGQSPSWQIDDFVVSEVSYPMPPPPPSPPGWFATLETGTPKSRSVTVTASALATDDVMVTGYEYSVNSGTTWVAITPTGNDFNITGLSPSTAYPAPLLRAKDADGNASAVLMAQAFSTSEATVGEVEWFGAVETPPPGASALFIRAHNGSIAYPTYVSVGGSAAELLSLGTDVGTNTVPRRVSMWWCADPGPSGEVVSDGGSGDANHVWEQVLYVAGLVPGEIQHNYNASNSTVVPHNPVLAPDGVAVSIMHHRTGNTAPTPNHDYFDSGTKVPPTVNAGMVAGVWTAGVDLPTDWTAARYHAQMTVALNPIGA